jgi:hypothetical protein
VTAAAPKTNAATNLKAIGMDVPGISPARDCLSFCAHVNQDVSGTKRIRFGQCVGVEAGQVQDGDDRLCRTCPYRALADVRPHKRPSRLHRMRGKQRPPGGIRATSVAGGRNAFSSQLGQFGSPGPVPSISFGIKKGRWPSWDQRPSFPGALRIWGPRAPSSNLTSSADRHCDGHHTRTRSPTKRGPPREVRFSLG